MNISLDRTLVDAYLSGSDLTEYQNAWHFTASTVSTDIGKNIFTQPPTDDASKATVRFLADFLSGEINDFQPINKAAWDALFPSWETESVHIDLIVGFPAPYDATTEYAPDGRLHIIFDLVQWINYAELENLDAIVRNLLTHEITHQLISKHCNGIDEAMESGDYLLRLDANTFNEGFAHLISFDGKELGCVNWHSEKLEAVYEAAKATMKAALAETDKAKQEEYLYSAVCGAYYKKFACMCGMLYLARRWEKDGVSGLENEFESFNGFAEKTVRD